MRTRLLLSVLVLQMLGSCDRGDIEPPGPGPEASAALVAGHPHLLLRSDVRSRRGYAAGGPHLTYFGGPVLSKVKVVTLFWSAQTQQQSGLNKFYDEITNSAYFDWLSEYNTPTQTIGRGSRTGSVVDPSPPSATSLSDAQIESEISKLIGNATLPANDANTLYMVHFPPGISIDLQGSGSCQEFCAYHNTFVRSGQDVFYGVIPDQGGACAGGCGNAPTLLANTTEVSSHELIEAVTDPAVGLATTNGPPLAWYDQTNGEIGDICVGSAGSVQGATQTWNVQTEWSNSVGDCILTNGGGGSGGSGGTGGSGGSGGGGAGGSGGSGGSSGSGGSGGSGGGGAGGSGGTGGTGGSGGGTCAHPICQTGSILTSSCDPCANQICASDAYCCQVRWDSTCVSEVSSICGQTCGGGTTCAHPICQTGSILTSSCDPCASEICTYDPYCCNTRWDSQCVSEVGSICGETCQ